MFCAVTYSDAHNMLIALTTSTLRQHKFFIKNVILKLILILIHLIIHLDETLTVFPIVLSIIKL